MNEYQCEWILEDPANSRVYETSCDKIMQFSVDGIEENEFKYCPFCGKEIIH